MRIEKIPSIYLAFIPLAILIILLMGGIYVYGDDVQGGALQISLLLAAAVAAIIGMLNGISWLELQKSFVQSISTALGSIMVLLIIGSLIGTWLAAGTIQTIIFYALQALNAEMFFFSACLICMFVSLCIGGSWATIATVGVAMLAAASTMGVSIPITTGAVISGAYFGDKMSPLSDTTNLAPAVVGVDLFVHIRHMVWTTLPSITISLIIFLILGFTSSTEGAMPVSGTLALLEANYAIQWHALLPLIIILFLAFRKTPAVPAIAVSTVVGALYALTFQRPLLLQFIGETDLPLFLTYMKAVWTIMFDGYISQTGNATLDSLLSRGGMSSMLNTIWLIITALFFGGIMERTGLLNSLLKAILSGVTSLGGLVVRTVVACIGTNIIAPDQYISVVLPGRMFRKAYEDRGLAPQNLSRILEDAGTLTSPLVPWNTCGAFIAGALGVPTLTYLPFCFFNLINPLVSMLYGIFNIRFDPLEDEEKSEAVPQE